MNKKQYWQKKTDQEFPQNWSSDPGYDAETTKVSPVQDVSD